MSTDPLSSTDGAGREWLLKGNFEGKPVAFGPDLAVGEEVEVVPRGRTRVLEEALDGALRRYENRVCADPDARGFSDAVGRFAREVREALASLAAVAVEDGGNDLGYERPPAATVTASLGADVEAVKRVLVERTVQKTAKPYAVEDTALEILAALRPPAAGTLAAEPPLTPEERT